MNRVALVVVLLSPLACLADDPPKPNTLTDKEIADGWILLFDGKTTFGWETLKDSTWTIQEGLLLSPQKGNSALLKTTSSFGDFDLKLDYLAKTRSFEVFIGKESATGSHDDFMGRWTELTVSYRNGRITEDSHVSGHARRAFRERQHLPPGPLWIGVAGEEFSVRNIKLKPVISQPLLNGKDLDGWKIYDGDKTRIKSKFSITKEGWLSLKDGPGDLQTTKEWADFVLQLECRTNGKHLNSGVFFRCLPGQYQMGYEAQIHNGFGDEKEYTLDVFDPRTNKPLDKKKTQYTALDFGTGAIYRRQPARFQASKDNEWFTMTVVARDRHFATWVNGIQQVDWTDNRPLGDNARVGAYLKKGPISIQGHDPTTDLHFRNIRIAELPSK
jgi:hypothetical protein